MHKFALRRDERQIDDSTNLLCSAVAYFRSIGVRASYMAAVADHYSPNTHPLECLDRLAKSYGLSLKAEIGTPSIDTGGSVLFYKTSKYSRVLLRPKADSDGLLVFSPSRGWELNKSPFIERVGVGIVITVDETFTGRYCFIVDKPVTYLIKESKVPQTNNDRHCYPENTKSPTDYWIPKSGMPGLARTQSEFEKIRSSRVFAALKQAPPKTISVQIIRDSHRLIMSGISSHAGQSRTINLSRGGVPYFDSRTVDKSLQNWAKVCQVFYSNQNRKAHPIQHLAMLLSDFNSIHPFRDGNGVVTTLLCHWLTKNTKRPCDLNSLPKSERYGAFNLARRGKLARLEGLLSGCLDNHG